ncbi:hypothetical protein XCCB100_0034 [Xanthomonas campestris pv. campestris]|uniref:Uncharacterized protein n=1 Tax=Xanthomonas campestris pv. campestris (strain B100) TaxID=509169 RepID=B0RLH1_XANCB|nr:hypothetical protein XCCB100_0034 [Xanthomonas campestris pv. campestris]
MVVSNILLRTFFIKAEAYGTAFTLEIDGEEFLVLRATSLVRSIKNFKFWSSMTRSGRA